MAFAIGHISGCHLNPAITVGLWAGGRFPTREIVPYVAAQVLGGIAAGGASFAPIAIGLALTLIHLISIPVTNTSVNPARSTAVAVYVGDWAIAQLWLFWVAPIAGGVLGALLWRGLETHPVEVTSADTAARA